MGGTLDATNILNNQAISVISKIARDHEAFLGNTLSEIAGHKAGILRPSVPYIVNSANERQVIHTIDSHAELIGAGPKLTTSSYNFEDSLYNSAKWLRLTRMMAPFQQENMKLATVAAHHTLETLNKSVKPTDIGKALVANMKTHYPGRQEMVQVPPVFRNPGEKKNIILVDGAHNPDAAEALNEVVEYRSRYGQTPSTNRPQSGWPVTWVLAMTEGKDAHAYLSKLLRPGDRVVTTAFGPVDGMPWVKPMDPKKLLQIAKSVEPGITGLHVPVLGALRAVSTAKYISNPLATWSSIVLTGSLYLVGDFHRELRSRSSKTWWTDTDEATAADRNALLQMQAEERERVNALLTKTAPGKSEAQQKLQHEIEDLDREVQSLEIEESRLVDENLSELERFERDERRFAEHYATPEQISEAVARAEKAQLDIAAHAKRLEEQAEIRAARKLKQEAQKARVALRREHRKAKKDDEKRQDIERQVRGGAFIKAKSWSFDRSSRLPHERDPPMPGPDEEFPTGQKIFRPTLRYKTMQTNSSRTNPVTPGQQQDLQNVNVDSVPAPSPHAENPPQNGLPGTNWMRSKPRLGREAVGNGFFGTGSSTESSPSTSTSTRSSTSTSPNRWDSKDDKDGKDTQYNQDKKNARDARLKHKWEGGAGKGGRHQWEKRGVRKSSGK